MKSFLRGWALAITPRGHLTCGIGGWVVSELFDIVHSLRPPPFRYINCIVKESVRGSSCLFPELVLDGADWFLLCRYSNCWKASCTVLPRHSKLVARVVFMHQEHIRWSKNRLFFSNSSYNGGWIDLLCAEALFCMYLDVNLSFFSSAIS